MADSKDEPTEDQVVPASELAASAASGSDGAVASGSADGSQDEAAESRTVSVAPFIDDDDDPADNDTDIDTDIAALGDADTDADIDGEQSGDDDSAGAQRGSGRKARGAKGAKGAKAGATDGTGSTPTVTRRVVTSKRVTPKGGPAGSPARKSKGQPADDGGFTSSRYTPPGGQGAYAKGPSPWWVPTLMFGLLIIGALVIMTNYMGVFGDAQNSRLVIGLVFILGGIVTATQYR